MKKILLLVLVACLVFFGIFLSEKKKKEDKNSKERDYSILKEVYAVNIDLAKTNSVKSFGNLGVWYQFELEVMKEESNDYFKRLNQELGSDFETRLSNGDRIYVCVLPLYNSIKIFAGGTDEKTNMIYPDWTYTKLDKIDLTK